MRIHVDSSMSYRGRNSRPNWLALLGFIGLAFAAGACGTVFSPFESSKAAAWYAALSKPAWTPPEGWFGPAWIVLYLLMGTAAWLVWHERYHRKRGTALTAYAVQLLLNALWAPLFFGAKNIGAGLFITVALCLAIVWTIREFVQVRALAAWLLAPYVVYAGFAMMLNLNLWRLNP
jgi:tryptophan-rich sensory protein